MLPVISLLLRPLGEAELLPARGEMLTAVSGALWLPEGSGAQFGKPGKGRNQLWGVLDA